MMMAVMSDLVIVSLICRDNFLNHRDDSELHDIEDNDSDSKDLNTET